MDAGPWSRVWRYEASGLERHVHFLGQPLLHAIIVQSWKFLEIGFCRADLCYLAVVVNTAYVKLDMVLFFNLVSPLEKPVEKCHHGSYGL